MDRLVFLLLVASTTTAYSNSDLEEPWLDWQLPKSLSPIHYDLFMQPDVFNREFDGNVSIQMKVLEQTNIIIVHIARMNVSNVQVFVDKTTELVVTRSFECEPNKYFVVVTEQPMMKGAMVKVNMKFRGVLQFLTGVISNDYTDSKTGEYSPMVMTTFKPDYARFAFPCFDEPFFKSRFTITIRHWANCTAVSNMLEERVTNFDNDWIDTTFKKTPEISTFSVSFAISSYASRNNTLPDGKTHRVWVRPDRVDQVDYALKVTSTIQGFLHDELGTIRSLQKIDQFDVPFTFYGGGQHHLGLIFHSDHRLTYHSTRAEEIYEQQILVTLATGLASNYFGSIVSCRSWDHVWLDSALADFYACKAATAVESLSFYEQQRKEQILIYDSISNSRPMVTIRTNTTKPDDVYHPLTVVKGAALMKMLEKSVLGDDRFKRGIKRYLRMNSRRTVQTQDLWDAIQSAIADAKTNVTDIMETWVYSMGYPVVTIQLLPGNEFNISQKRFLLDPTADLNSPPSTHGYNWHVFINYKVDGGRTGRILWNKTLERDHLYSPMDPSDNWILFNHDQSGYYRVNYDVALWDNITKQLLNDHKVFTDPQRSQLLSDALNLAEAEQLGFDTALSLTTYASKERYLPAWLNIYDALGKIHAMLSNTSDLERFKKYVLSLTTDVMNELGVTDEGTTEQRILRGTIIPMSCSAGHQSCREATTRLFKAWIEDEKLNAIPLNIRRTVYCNGIANSEIESEWNTTFSRFIAQKRSKERGSLLIGMACTRNLTLLDRFLERFLSNETLEDLWFTELEQAIVELRTNPKTNDYIWDWLKDNCEQIDARYSVGSCMWLTGPVTRNFNTEAQLQDVRDFFARTSTLSCFDALKNQTETVIRANIRFLEKHYAKVSTWLEQNAPV